MTQHSSHLKHIVLTSSILLCCFTLNLHAAKFYKWTDSDGNIHFSDTPPDENNATEAIDINTKAPRPSGEIPAKFNLEEIERKKQDELNAIKNTEEKAKHLEKCKIIKNRLKTLQSEERVTETNEQGQRRYLDDDEKQDQIQQAEQKIGQHCG